MYTNIQVPYAAKEVIHEGREAFKTFNLPNRRPILVNAMGRVLSRGNG